MKKLFSVILAVALLMSMAACGSFSPEEPEVPYVASADIEVALAFIDDGARVVTRKHTDKTLKAFDLACVYYTTSGLQIGTYELVECEFSSQNTLSIWLFDAPLGGVYMDAAIASVTYEDGTKEECPGVSTWAKNTAAAFSVENYEKRTAEMKKLQATAAENCPGAKISVSAVADGKLPIEMSNTSGKEISDTVIYMLWFNEAGVPLDCGGVLVPNSENISSGSMAVDETGNYTVDAPEAAVNAKPLIKQITYADGTVWENDYVYEWTFVNYSAFE